MTTPHNWRKSSYSGEGDGNNCLEIAHSTAQVAIRDSKAPARATLTFRAPTFATFVRTLKNPTT
ncbi:DUF397 domain-containing protein [Streptomyces bobili]|uniref:DUF397 domain-containing protein n=1 Tax=Streptomyces bobili TaxID=67280 RepID=UPI0033BD29C2